MSWESLEATARELIASGKGILAADETVPTLTARLEARGIPSTEETRRAYRQMLFTTPGLGRFISGAILFDETMHQVDDRGRPLPEVLSRAGIMPGIKVDTGAHPLAACPGEVVTEGLDGLRDRLEKYRAQGARFAKWRAVFHVSEALPSATCIDVNANALARYAALCQEQALVPIVEPEVLMDGAHELARTEEVTNRVLEQVFFELRRQRVLFEGMLLKPSMVVAGTDAEQGAGVLAVAEATLRVLRRQVPVAVPGIVFLSGGQDERTATAHLQAMNRASETHPWTLSFSYGRALQDPAMDAWAGLAANVPAAQAALMRRALCNSAACLGRYEVSLEGPRAPGEMTLH